jgi:UDP-N-acetylmuramoyl-L-alanyl-D-glutamate--2,6-diaminopimelate ligase
MEAGIELKIQKKHWLWRQKSKPLKLQFNWQPKDIILIAGKGHETYQEINGVKHDFDDLKWVKRIKQLEK